MAANLKKVVTQYCATHKIQQTVNKLVNRLVLERPDDPYDLLSVLCAAESNAPRGVLKTNLDVVLDEHGKSVFELAITLNSGVYYGRQSCGLNVITPQIEIPPPKDPDEEEEENEETEQEPQKPMVLAYVKGNIGQEVEAMLVVMRKNFLPQLQGQEPTDQAHWDKLIAAATQDISTPTPQLEEACRAIAMACSIAICRTGAALQKIPLYRHIADVANRSDDVYIPVPAVSVLTGGAFTLAKGNIAPMNEIYVLPVGAESYREALSLGRRIYARVQEYLKDMKPTTNSRGSSDANFESLEQCLGLVHKAILTSGCGDRVKIGLAMDAPRLYEPATAVELEDFPEDDIPGTYDLKTIEGKLTSPQLAQTYNALMLTYPIAMLEDPFDVFPDQSGTCRSWIRYVEEVGRGIHVVGKRLVGKDPAKVAKAGENNVCNGATLRWTDHATISDALTLVTQLHEQYWGIILEDDQCTCDDSFIADFAVGAQIGNVRAGGLAGLGHILKYNRLLQIEDEVGKHAEFVGLRFLAGLSS